MADVPDEVLHAAQALFAPDAAHGASLALVVQHRGRVTFEQYGTQPDTIFGPGGPVHADTTLISWSMAKSITHAAVGIAVGDGLLDVSAPAPVDAWIGTPREPITIDQLLEMRSGLEFVEDYVDDAISHCLEMLYGAGKDDMAAYAAGLPLLHQPGTVWNYSSGTTNIVARIVGNAVGGQAGMERLLLDRLFGPIGMASAVPKFDPAGTFVGSSYVYATARDFAKFGQLYLDDGMVDGHRILPAGWRDHARRAVSVEEETGFGYGRQWWLWPQFEGLLACHGYEGQYTLVAPDRELVVVHLGKSPIESRQPLIRALAGIVQAYAP
ncbi:MAG: Serine hydrolase [Ilumatobacteraceae bacterium]|nr:Serine hydrolase [Ilumatobacteraceae bacterium]